MLIKFALKFNSMIKQCYRRSIHQLNNKLKILGSGDIKSKFDFEVNFVSDSAKKKIEAAGGTCEVLS